MPEPTKQYLFTAAQMKAMFAAVTGGMFLILTAIFLLITARPQGTFTSPDTSQFDLNLAAAAEQLEGYRELEDGTVQIDIHRAIELVAQRGVESPFTASGAMGDAGAAPGAEGGEGPAAAARAEGQAAAQEPEGQPTQEAAQADLPDGSQVYANCVSCHQANGAGIPGVFPPLSGHAADLYEADPAYLARAVLFGVQGPITVQGSEYNGNMPAWGSLDDEQIAAVLNYMLSSWDNAGRVEEQPYTASEIDELRSPVLSAQEVHASRGDLDLP